MNNKIFRKYHIMTEINGTQRMFMESGRERNPNALCAVYTATFM